MVTIVILGLIALAFVAVANIVAVEQSRRQMPVRIPVNHTDERRQR